MIRIAVERLGDIAGRGVVTWRAGAVSLERGTLTEADEATIFATLRRPKMLLELDGTAADAGTDTEVPALDTEAAFLYSLTFLPVAGYVADPASRT